MQKHEYTGKKTHIRYPSLTHTHTHTRTHTHTQYLSEKNLETSDPFSVVGSTSLPPLLCLLLCRAGVRRLLEASMLLMGWSMKTFMGG
jgi:hypothetical protein